MNGRNILLTLFFAGYAAGADDGQQFASIGNFELKFGGVVEDCRIGFRALGELNADRSNIVIVPTWFTGTSADLIDNGIIGPGKLADTDKYHVIAFDALGNGVSSSPSTSASQAYRQFPGITIEDMVTAQHRALTGHLRIDHVKAVLGISMGGMQTFQWMTRFPEFMDKAVPIDGSPRMTSYDILQWQTHKEIIELMQDAGKSNDEIMQIVSPLTLLTLWTPDYIVDNVRAENLAAFLAESLAGYAGRDGYDYLTQLQAMLGLDLLGGSEASRQKYVDSVRAEVLVVGVPADQMVNPQPAKMLAGLLGADYLALDSNCGHMGSSCESARAAARVNEFLARP